jgi:GntR family transcriptional regulator
LAGTATDIAQFVSLRRRVGAALAERIYRGALKPGDAIPTGQELARDFGVSPGTVRQAVMDLVGLGLVYRKQGKGTFVSRPLFDHSLTNYFRDPATGERILNPPARVLKIDTIRPPAAVRERLRLDDGRVHRIRRLRLHGDRPIMVQTLHLPVQLFPQIDGVDFAVFQYPMFEKLYGIYVLRAEEQLRPGVAGDDDAALLGFQRGSPVVLVERTAYSRDDVPIEFRQTVGRGDRYAYTFDLR